MRAVFLLLAVVSCGRQRCEQDAVDERGTCEAFCQVNFTSCDQDCGVAEAECLDACADVPCREACEDDGASCVQQCGFTQDSCVETCAEEEEAAFAACG